MKKTLTMLLLFLGMFNFLKAQIKVSDYPEGLYATLEDFYNKKPSSTEKVMRVFSWINIKEIPDSVKVNQCYFYHFRDSSKVIGKKNIAIVHKGELYFSEKVMLNNSIKNKGRSFLGEYPNVYHRVITDGNFLYLEKINLGSSNPGMMYGAVGAGLGMLLTKSSNLSEMPIIFDTKKKEFALFHKCKFFNEFLEKEGYEKFIVNCKDKNDKFSSEKVKSFVDQVNQLGIE